MNQIKVFTRSYIDRIYDESQKTPDTYLTDNFDVSEDAYAIGETGLVMVKETIGKINESEGSPKEDITNSIRIFEALDINLTTASDPRLWTCLTHTLFWPYMRKRWNLESLNEEKQKSRIKDRYHLKNLSLNNLSRNGIARLWWMAYLTVDNEKEDRYELTKVLASRQDLIAGLMERYLGSNESIRKAILKFLSENKSYLENEDKRRDLLKQVNLIGGVKNLPLLNEPDIENELTQIT